MPQPESTNDREGISEYNWILTISSREKAQLFKHGVGQEEGLKYIKSEICGVTRQLSYQAY